MAKNTKQLPGAILVEQVNKFLREDENYKIIMGELMVPSEIGGYTSAPYELDQYLGEALGDHYHNQRSSYLDTFERIIEGATQFSRTVKAEDLDVDTLIDPDRVIDEAETVKVGNGFIEGGQFKEHSEGIYIHRIQTNYLQDLGPEHRTASEGWDLLLNYMSLDDPDLKDRLQLFLGSVFLVLQSERKAFSQFGLFGGASGSGKSTLFKLVGNALGLDKTVDLKLGEYADDNKLKEAKNRLLVIDHELDSPISGSRSTNIKQAAEGGQFIINSKYVNAYTMNFTGTIVLATNKPYDYIIPEEEENGLNRRLQDFWLTTALPEDMGVIINELLNDDTGVVNEVVLRWLVQGYQKLYRNNFLVISEREEIKQLPIGYTLEEANIDSKEWIHYSVKHGLIRKQVRRQGERVRVIEKDPRGSFLDYVSYRDVYDNTVENVEELLKAKGWKEGKKLLNARILYHFDLESTRVRKGGERVRVYLPVKEESDQTMLPLLTPLTGGKEGTPEINQISQDNPLSQNNPLSSNHNSLSQTNPLTNPSHHDNYDKQTNKTLVDFDNIKIPLSF